VQLVLVGPSGCGKTTVGRALATALGRDFLDADDLHAPEARAKMAAGIALHDIDRWPWLARLGKAMSAMPDAVVACSALRRAYRDRLPGRKFLLDAPRAVLASRLAHRKGHFMPASLLDSQLEALERGDDLEVIDATLPLDAQVAELVRRAQRRSVAKSP